MQETRVWSLSQEDPLEKEMATHSSTLSWKIPGTDESDRPQSMGSQRVRHDWATSLHFTNILAWEIPRTGESGGLQSSSVQSLSRVQLFATPWTTAHQASLSISNSWSLPKLMSIESVMPSNHLILCHPLLPLPSIFPNIRVFSNELDLRIRWPKYWSFSFNISPSNEHPGLISFRMDWLDLFAVQGTLKSLLQQHSSKASILWHSAFFIVHLSHPYMTTGKTVALTRQTFVDKVMSLLSCPLSHKRGGHDWVIKQHEMYKK